MNTMLVECVKYHEKRNMKGWMRMQFGWLFECYWQTILVEWMMHSTVDQSQYNSPLSCNSSQIQNMLRELVGGIIQPLDCGFDGVIEMMIMIMIALLRIVMINTG